MLSYKSKNSQGDILTTAYVTGVPILIYSLGIRDANIRKVVLVKILSDSQRAGIRPFKVSSDAMSEICQILGLEFKEMEAQELTLKNNPFSAGDLVDCQVIYKIKTVSFDQRVKVLALQHEYVNFKRPSIFKGYSPSLRKRIDLLVKLVIPFRLFKYYGLALKPKPHGLLKELPIDHYQVQKYRKKIFDGLAKVEGFRVLKTLRRENAGSKVCIVFPFAKHWGGTDELNKKLFRLALDEHRNGGFDKLIIKNHPSDPQTYSEILPAELRSINPTVISDVFDRTIPIEIIVEAFESYRFIGTESTAFMTLSPFVSDPTIIVDSELQISKRYQKYVSGETRKQYLNQVIRI